MSRYYYYRVELTNGGNRILVKVRDPEGKTRNPKGPSKLSKIPARISALVKKVQRGKTSRTEMEELGEELFKALFSEEIATNFRDLLAQVSDEEIDESQQDVDDDTFLRLELDLDENELPAVAALPWEFLRAPQTASREGSNLGTHAKMTLSRRRDHWDYTKPIPRTKPLRIQLVISKPKDEELGTVAYKEIKSALQKLAQTHPDQIAPLSKPLHKPTLVTINQVLEERKPDILHFIGHGRLVRSARGIGFGELALVGPGESADWCDAKQIGELFEEHKPAVVILQACESGAEGLSEAFVGVASQVVQHNVPVVVAMQYPIDNNAAIIFAKEFYRRLGQFKPVDMAVQRGRRLLRQKFGETRDFAVPILFMRVEDGQLFIPPKTDTSQEPASGELDKKVAPIKDAPSPSFPQSFIAGLPHPIAVACAEFSAAQTDKDRFAALDRLINNLVQYLTAIALSQYWQDKPDKDQLRAWLAGLSQARLTTSLTVFSQISAHYLAAADKSHFYALLFEPYTIPVDDASAIADAYELVRHLRRGKRQSEEITPQAFLTRLLALREKKWEADVSQVDVKIQEQLLPVLQPALEQLFSIFRTLFHYPLRYIDRVDPDGQDWVYTTVEFPGSKGEPVVSEPFFCERGIDKPNYPAHRLYLCAPDGQPKLNLHPFLIAHLYKLYFLEQAADRDNNVWYQHCASAERYNPPKFYSSIFLSASKTDKEMEEADDPVNQLEQASSKLEEDESKSRFDAMPLPVLSTHLSAEGRQVLEIALGEALRIGRFWLGVEFLLMGLSKQTNGIFFKLLREIGLDPGEMRGALRGMVGVVKKEEDRWRQQNVAALGKDAFPELRVAEPDLLRQNLVENGEPPPVITPRMLIILQDAAKLTGKGEDQAYPGKIGQPHLLMALFRQHRSLAMQLFFSLAHEAGWPPEQVLARMAELAGAKPKDFLDAKDTPDSPDALPLPPGRSGRPPRSRPRGGSILTEFGRDLTQAAQEGKLHPAEGESARQAMAQIGRILLQREANNPILVGDPGVGKTAVVEGFAWRLAGGGKGAVKQLAGRRVVELSANTLTAGTKYRGQLEERLQQLLAQVKKAEGKIIIFIDEIHSILGGGSTGGLADAIKPALSRGEFPCIGATTVAEYRQHIEKDAALARRFTPVWLEEPSLEEAIKIVEKVTTGHLAEYHNATFAPGAIEGAVRLSARYLHDERLPGKAIKLLDQAASGLIIGASLSGDPDDQSMVMGGTVTVDAILQVVADRTNISLPDTFEISNE